MEPRKSMLLTAANVVDNTQPDTAAFVRCGVLCRAVYCQPYLQQHLTKASEATHWLELQCQQTQFDVDFSACV